MLPLLRCTAVTSTTREDAGLLIHRGTEKVVDVVVGAVKKASAPGAEASTSTKAKNTLSVAMESRCGGAIVSLMRGAITQPSTLSITTTINTYCQQK